MPNYNQTLQTNNSSLEEIITQLNNMPDAGSGGNTDAEDTLITRAFTTYINDRVKTIGNCVFYNCYNLTSVSFPVCTTIGIQTFGHCSSLTSIYFPACTSIGMQAFTDCSNLTSANFPACISIGPYAFQSCFKLTLVSFPVCTTIGVEAFFACSNLISTIFPVCTIMSRAAFAYCSNLTSVNFPACTSIGNQAFYNCANLISLYLLGSNICTLSNSNAFTSTPIGGYSTAAGKYGNIYVPASLLTAYKSATNWTYFSSRFVGV